MASQIVILGGSGFIGKALAQFLRGNGLVVTAYGSLSLDLTSPESSDRLCDLLSEDSSVVLAARARPERDSFEYLRKNIAIATNVARCLTMRRVRRFIFFSTTSVYGDWSSNPCITEDTQIAPTSLYGTAKFASECILKHASEKRGIPTVILRPCMVYGPGDTSEAYGPGRFMRSILQDRKVQLFGDGSESRDYLFVRDAAEIASWFVCGDQSGTFNLAGGCSYTFQELVACLRAVVPVEFQVVSVERDRPKADQRLNPAKLFKLLPNFKFTDLKQGLLETYLDFSTRLAC